MIRRCIKLLRMTGKHDFIGMHIKEVRQCLKKEGNGICYEGDTY